MKIVDHDTLPDHPEEKDPPGFSLSVNRTTWPRKVAEIHVHTHIASNRPGVFAYAPVDAAEALALADALRTLAYEYFLGEES